MDILLGLFTFVMGPIAGFGWLLATWKRHRLLSYVCGFTVIICSCLFMAFRNAHDWMYERMASGHIAKFSAEAIRQGEAEAVAEAFEAFRASWPLHGRMYVLARNELRNKLYILSLDGTQNQSEHSPNLDSAGVPSK